MEVFDDIESADNIAKNKPKNPMLQNCFIN